LAAKYRERLAVSKQRSHRLHMVGFNLKKLIKTQCKEEYIVEISTRIGGLENLDAEMDIKRAWETIRYNIKISTKETVGF
jgi:hypothetical protein